jgi:hypothetical protein
VLVGEAEHAQGDRDAADERRIILPDEDHVANDRASLPNVIRARCGLASAATAG